MVTVLAHLWARLLESSAEIRSAILLQRSYRSYLKRTGRGDIAERTHGAKAERSERLAGKKSLQQDVPAAMIEEGVGPIGECLTAFIEYPLDGGYCVVCTGEKTVAWWCEKWPHLRLLTSVGTAGCDRSFFVCFLRENIYTSRLIMDVVCPIKFS